MKLIWQSVTRFGIDVYTCDIMVQSYGQSRLGDTIIAMQMEHTGKHNLLYVHARIRTSDLSHISNSNSCWRHPVTTGYWPSHAKGSNYRGLIFVKFKCSLPILEQIIIIWRREINMSFRILSGELLHRWRYQVNPKMRYTAFYPTRQSS
jgi:hypothetical protein